MGSVRTSILRRPRRLSPHRRADHGEVRSYTLDWEEPKKVCGHQKIAGVPKVDVIQTGARALVDAGVRHAADLQATNEDHKKAYTSVRGLGPVTWSYFGMLLGTSDVKADTMIVRYVSRQLRRVVESGEARRMLLLVAERLRQEPRALDHAVWRFERDPNNRRRELS